jgi:hypothetical protein
MVIIAFGVYSESDKNKVDNFISNLPTLRILWDYKDLHIDEEEGLFSLKDYLKLYKTGLIVNASDYNSGVAYTLIDEITNYCIKGNPYPSFFSFVDALNLDKFVLAFADEWEKSDLIRFESISLKDVNKRLNSVYVWCEEYLNLQTNTLSFDDTHPLVLDVHN